MWVVEAAYGCGTFVRHFDTPTAAHGWEFLMTSNGYETAVTEPVGAARRLRVINGGRGEGACPAQPRPQKERNSMSDLHSGKAPSETPDETDTDLSTYRVLRQDDTNVWTELEEITSKYVPLASDVGEAYGEGDYLLIEKDSRYSFMSTYEMRVVAEKRYRLADDETA